MDAKIELKRYSCAVIAAVLFAVNIKTFVKAGGLYPGDVYKRQPQRHC